MTAQSTNAPAVAHPRCRSCNKLHPRADPCISVPGLLPDRPPAAPRAQAAPPAKVPKGQRSASREPDPDVRPQVAGLVLPDDVLMLAQAAAGEADLVEWICGAIRDKATPRAATLVPAPAAASAGAKTQADYQRAYRARKAAAKATESGAT